MKDEVELASEWSVRKEHARCWAQLVQRQKAVKVHIDHLAKDLVCPVKVYKLATNTESF